MASEIQSRPVVVVTGASGLIGSRVSKAISADYQVVGADIKPPDEEIPGAEFIEADLTDDSSVEQLVAEVRRRHGDRVASVVHLAAYYDFSGDPSPMYDELTVGGTRRLLRSLQQIEVEQFIFSSSLLVMKPVETGEALREDSPLQAEWAYPDSKVKAELAVREEQGRIPAAIARVAGVYDEMGHSIPIAQQIKRIYDKDLESYFFPGDAEHGQSFIHLEDVVGFFAALIEHRKQLEHYEVFLVGEPDVVSYGEIQEIVGEAVHGEAWPALRMPKIAAKAGAWVENKFASGDEGQFIKPWMIDIADAHYPVDISHAEKKLQWRPKHGLRLALPRMVANLKADPRGWCELNHLPPPEDAS